MNILGLPARLGHILIGLMKFSMGMVSSVPYKMPLSPWVNTATAMQSRFLWSSLATTTSTASSRIMQRNAIVLTICTVIYYLLLLLVGWLWVSTLHHRCGVFAGRTVWSTPERLRGEVLTTRRYTNLRLPLSFTLPQVDAILLDSALSR